MRAHVGEPQRLRVPDQDAEHAAPPRGLADLRPRRLVEADGEEALELPALLVENAERRVARARELAPRVKDAPKHDLEIEVRGERPPDVDQEAQLVLVELPHAGPAPARYPRARVWRKGISSSCR